ncbi:hypothetical protein A9W99_14915 [Mycobacterium sp. 1164966.3]|uniref:hypothetical protein n=1 Tax=Mycobacterium sp. 1164966.3 TaxID=1856861 RepID=UPI000801CDEF|nr:hypothetical protein [Mycobacterium sp. 1164966.3]OBA81143.1 hypothetical protein A9W99_14915 [Mycobacterium sp. 1164966.3]
MLWRYVKLQFSMLVCGVVGPLFLIEYFSSGRPSGSKWMLYVGLFVTVYVFLVPPMQIIRGSKAAARRAALEQGGVLALAEVTGIAQTGTQINDQPLVKVQLHISGSGFEPFNSEDRLVASVSRLPNITARKLVVVVDPATQEHQIDWERSALVNGLVPMKFAVAEDDKTYDLSGQTGPVMEILQILKANNVQLNDDIRSNPAARQQVLAVVRKAAEQQAVAAPAAPQASTAERLQNLETLRASGAVTEEEYNTHRVRIISQM